MISTVHGLFPWKINPEKDLHRIEWCYRSIIGSNNPLAIGCEPTKNLYSRRLHVLALKQSQAQIVHTKRTQRRTVRIKRIPGNEKLCLYSIKSDGRCVLTALQWTLLGIMHNNSQYRTRNNEKKLFVSVKIQFLEANRNRSDES